MQLVVFCGIQATGKSTFYEQRFFHSHLRLSLDLLRTRHREQRLFETCLATQTRCVIDNTNPTRAERASYIRWRQEDAGRNALSAHCYWLLRRQGQSVAEATARVAGQGTAAKHDLLFSYGINYHNLPAWQKRGVGVQWQEYSKPGFNPHTQLTTNILRRRLTAELELPFGPAYETYLAAMLAQAEL